ncbi:MAG: diaminopimelate decarboxylase, partial [Gammaproteobacteria bacterium]|nr:diaminopimelate decarboxylase [Gammaproteobacteria bacterium]
MPISKDFEYRLTPLLHDIVAHYGTPFHLYDEVGIRQTGARLNDAFSRFHGFKEYFAVKALPNPAIMRIMRSMGFGFDCSSIAELRLARMIDAHGDEIMFTSNNTSRAEFIVAESEGGVILNLDDISLVPKVPTMPDLISFRYNPGAQRTGNDIIGNPLDAKYGVSTDQLLSAYRDARERGARRFGIHTMLVSNERNPIYMVETARMLLALVEELGAELDAGFEFINIGGGLGIPYQPEDKPFDIDAMAEGLAPLFQDFQSRNGYAPKLFMESGRYMTGPHGALITKAINHKAIYRNYVGVDACMSALMRPAMYDAYHHITVFGEDGIKKDDGEIRTVDVVGSLCENNDKFATQRPLPRIEESDILCIHDTGAHGHAMGFNYNGRVRP